MIEEEEELPELMPPHGAAYDPASGKISRMFTPNSIEQDEAQVLGYIESGMAPPGSKIFYSESPIDNGLQMVDVSADPLVLIDLPPDQIERI